MTRRTNKTTTAALTVTPEINITDKPETIAIPYKLVDIHLQRSQLSDHKPGNYILSYRWQNTVVNVPVYWDGEQVHA